MVFIQHGLIPLDEVGTREVLLMDFVDLVDQIDLITEDDPVAFFTWWDCDVDGKRGCVESTGFHNAWRALWNYIKDKITNLEL